MWISREPPVQSLVSVLPQWKNSGLSHLQRLAMLQQQLVLLLFAVLFNALDLCAFPFPLLLLLLQGFLVLQRLLLFLRLASILLCLLRHLLPVAASLCRQLLNISRLRDLQVTLLLMILFPQGLHLSGIVADQVADLFGIHCQLDEGPEQQQALDNPIIQIGVVPAQLLRPFAKLLELHLICVHPFSLFGLLVLHLLLLLLVVVVVVLVIGLGI
mmetsp:Transcript_66218/g.110595  ORF Transcript_66218/g.110595 Transcript_66218/m.110595 type:complete len:214 (+) Transcript_66218:932-1573(+)